MIKQYVNARIWENIMAGSINKVTLIGNLGRDPEVRSMQDGGKIVQLSIATSETWKDKNSGERREKTEWHRVVIFNENLGRTAEQYLRKGSTVYVEGQLQTRKWTDQQGQEKYTTEVVLQRYRGELTMLGGRSEQSSSIGYDDTNSNAGSSDRISSASFNNPSPGPMSGIDDLDDEIPF